MDNYIEIRFGGDIFWISEPRPDVDLQSMTDGFEVHLRRIGASSYAPQRFWRMTDGAAIAAAMERITGHGIE
jgi:hypothetical protein